MKRQREEPTNRELDKDSNPVSRARKIPGIGSRGVGIKVHGDDPFDPHRFQDFEVTPAFRQQILEAPLPLLELRELLVDQTPQSRDRPRAGADDITQAALPTTEPSAEVPVLNHSHEQPAQPELALPLTQTVDRDAPTAKMRPCPKAETPSDSLAIDANSTQSSARWPMRSLLIAGALGLLLLGLAFAHLNKPATDASPRQTAKADIQAPPLPEPKAAENNRPMPAAEPQKPAVPPAAAAESRGQSSAQRLQAKVDPSPVKEPARDANNPAKPSSKQGPAKKTLWLPAE